MIGKLKINGKDAWANWGVFLENGSYNKLLSGEEMKPYTENQSREIDGKRVQVSNPRVADRDVTLVLCFTKTNTSFINKLDSLITELKKGVINFQVSEISSTFKFIYLGNMNLDQIGLEIGKIAIRFNEPNPNDR